MRIRIAEWNAPKALECVVQAIISFGTKVSDTPDSAGDWRHQHFPLEFHLQKRVYCNHHLAYLPMIRRPEYVLHTSPYSSNVIFPKDT